MGFPALRGRFLTCADKIRLVQLILFPAQHPPIVDAIGREAFAQTSAIAREFRLLIRAGLSETELSITLYHEILEAASVVTASPPASVMDFKEADFERAGREAHQRWGKASPANLNLLLQFHGFRGQ